MSEDQDQPEGRRERRFAGLRLVGIFVPWQAVALTLAVVVALTSVAAVRWAGDSHATVHLAAAEDSTTTTTTAASTGAGDVEAPTTTTTAAPTTTTTAAKTTTTTVPATTTTTLAPGWAEVVLVGPPSPVSFLNGTCNTPASDWNKVAGCPESPRPDLDFTLNGARYPASARFSFDVVTSPWFGATYCLRVFDLDHNSPVAGTEKCWSNPPVDPPAAGQPWPIPKSYAEAVGPAQFPRTAGNYTLQAKVTETATGAGCTYAIQGCQGQLSRAKITIEWG